MPIRSSILYLIFSFLPYLFFVHPVVIPLPTYQQQRAEISLGIKETSYYLYANVSVAILIINGGKFLRRDVFCKIFSSANEYRGLIK
jgi:hypothetical protein